ncbi:MAG TPA: ubiquinol-cytochrome C chaperone family protein [Sphingomonas sp.]|jgi:cytochrome b pre-mRNA-processing protein 3|nr:ubiquinol-cytochrome C chaperone family protein [Sphingomonas sp.]
MRTLGWLANIFGSTREEAMLPLYNAVVERARQPHWYLDGGVPDTVDGRFDMIAAVLAFVLMRLEGVPEGAAPSAQLAERFVDDMDGQLRQMGIGDIVVGKHIGQMMAMLGGRLGAYRDGLAVGSLDDALVRNLYRGEAPAPAALAHSRDALLALHAALAATPPSAIIEGIVP